MEVPFFNYRETFQHLEEEFVTQLRDVIARGAYIQQRDLSEFEENLARYLGVKHAIGVGNATDGLTMLLRAAGVVDGDEVLVPSHTMVATVASIVHAGGKPVLVDCGDDHLFNTDSARSRLTDRTRFVLPVHLNGRVADMDKIMSLCEEFGLTVVEDAAQALGARFKDRYAGTFGAGGAFSFYPAKLLGCLGDGGAVVTDNDEVAQRVKLMRDHGRTETGEVVLWGYNSRLDNLQAAFLNLQFSHYGEALSARRAIAKRYHDGLTGIPELHLPQPPSNGHHFDVFQNYEIEAERRDDLQDYLLSNGIRTNRQWGGKAVHQFSELRMNHDLPRTDLLFARCLLLPLNTGLEDFEVDHVIYHVKKFYA